MPPTDLTLTKNWTEPEDKKRLFRSGDEVSMNCTARKSKPRAQLAWFINDRPVSAPLLNNNNNNNCM